MLVEQQTCPLETLMPENGHFPFKLWSQREIVILFRKRSSLFPKEPPLLLLGCLLSISHPISYIKHRATLFSLYTSMIYNNSYGVFLLRLSQKERPICHICRDLLLPQKVSFSHSFGGWHILRISLFDQILTKLYKLCLLFSN